MKSLKEWREIQEIAVANPTKIPPVPNPVQPPMSKAAMGRDLRTTFQSDFTQRGANAAYSMFNNIMTIAQNNPMALNRIVAAIKNGIINSDIDDSTKTQILGELPKARMGLQIAGKSLQNQ